jgi:hypothetical protein
MFDQTSRRRLQIFGCKLLLVMPVLLGLAVYRGFPFAETLSFFCLWHSVFAALASLVQSQKVNAPCLNAWDEMAAFAGSVLLTRLTAAVMA